MIAAGQTNVSELWAIYMMKLPLPLLSINMNEVSIRICDGSRGVLVLSPIKGSDTNLKEHDALYLGTGGVGIPLSLNVKAEIERSSLFELSKSPLFCLMQE